MTPDTAIFPDTKQERDLRKEIEEVKRILFPPPEIGMALRLYGIPESQQLDIVRFLLASPSLAQILLEAVPHLENVFGDVYLYLELEPDPEGGEEEIFGVIRMRGDPEQALELLRRFDEMWFSKVAHDVRRRVNFTIDTEGSSAGIVALAPDRSADQAPESREVELAWIERNRDTLAKFAGQWIVLEGERLFAAHPSLAEARKEALKQGVRYPFVYRVPNESENPIAL